MLSIPWRGSGQPDEPLPGTLLTSVSRRAHFGSMRCPSTAGCSSPIGSENHEAPNFSDICWCKCKFSLKRLFKGRRTHAKQYDVPIVFTCLLKRNAGPYYFSDSFYMYTYIHIHHARSLVCLSGGPPGPPDPPDGGPNGTPGALFHYVRTPT